jgi:WD40 repeat protein
MRRLQIPLLSEQVPNIKLPSTVSSQPPAAPLAQESNFEQVKKSLKYDLPKEIPISSVRQIQESSLRYVSQKNIANEKLKFSDDGKWLILQKDSVIKVLDMCERGQVIKDIHCSDCDDFAVSKDKRWLAAGLSSGETLLFDMRDRRNIDGECKQVLKCDSTQVCCLKFSDNSKLLAVGYSNDTVIVYESCEEWISLRKLSEYEGIVRCISFSCDGKYIATGSQNSLVILWKLTEEASEQVIKHTDVVTCVAFSVNGKFIASCTNDCTVRIWNLEQEKDEIVPLKCEDTISSLAFSIDGAYLAAAGFDGKVIIWNVGNGAQVITLNAHTGPVDDLAFMNDGKLITASIKDKTAILRKIFEEVDEKVLISHTENINCLSVSKDGRLLATCFNKRVIIWDLLKGSILKRLESPYDSFRNVAFSSDGKYIITEGKMQSGKIWNLDEEVSTVTKEDHPSTIRKLAKSRGSKTFIGNISSKVSLENIDGTFDQYEASKLWPDLLLSLPADVTCIAFSKDGNFVATALQDKTVIIRNPSNGAQLQVLKGHTDLITSLAFSKDGKFLASASKDGTARIWEYLAPSETQLFEGHTTEITCLAYSKDGRFLVTGGADKAVIIWNILTGLQERILLDFIGKISCLKFSRDGEYLLVASSNSVRYLNFSRLTAKDSYSKQEIYSIRYRYEFIRSLWIKFISRGGIHNYRSEFNCILVMPYHINSLHMLAYDNRSDEISQALSMGCPIIKSIYSESPVTISLKRRTIKCLDKLLEYISKLQEKAKTIAVVNAILQDIPGIIASESTQVIPFLEFLFRTIEPTFINPIYVLPMTTYTNYFSPNISLEFDDQSIDNTKNDSQLVEISYSAFKWNLYSGSRDSIRLLKSIFNSRNKEVYRHKLVQTIIDIKWNQQFGINLTLFILNMINLLFLLVMIFHEDLEVPLYIPSIGFIVINSLFGIYEVLQGIFSGFSYFRDPWNWLDMIKSPLSITCGIQGILGDSHYILTPFTALVCWIRGLAYFRTFKYTRIFVSMILTAIRDTSSFLIVLLYVTIAYCSLFKALDLYVKPEDKLGIVDTIKLAYELELGDFDSDKYSIGQYIIFIVASILNLIVMLNLLISILGDSYDKVQLTLVESDYSQKLEVILEIEKMLFFNRNKGTRTYLHKCDVYRNEFSEMEWEGRIRLIQDSMQQVSNLILKSNSHIESLLLNLQRSLEQKIDEKLNNDLKTNSHTENLHLNLYKNLEREKNFPQIRPRRSVKIESIPRSRASSIELRTVHDEKVRQLCEMGFEEGIVIKALENAQWDEETALDTLIG